MDLRWVVFGPITHCFRRGSQIKEADSPHGIVDFHQVRGQLSCFDAVAVSDSVLVELAGREVPDQGMHSILDREHLLFVPRLQEALKETP